MSCGDDKYYNEIYVTSETDDKMYEIILTNWRLIVNEIAKAFHARS